jgi:hypothetical protein
MTRDISRPSLSGRNSTNSGGYINPAVFVKVPYSPRGWLTPPGTGRMLIGKAEAVPSIRHLLIDWVRGTRYPFGSSGFQASSHQPGPIRTIFFRNSEPDLAFRALCMRNRLTAHCSSWCNRPGHGDQVRAAVPSEPDLLTFVRESIEPTIDVCAAVATGQFIRPSCLYGGVSPSECSGFTHRAYAGESSCA